MRQIDPHLVSVFRSVSVPRVELLLGKLVLAIYLRLSQWAAISPVDGSLLITSRAEARLWVLDPGSLEIIDDVSLDGIGHQISLEAY